MLLRIPANNCLVKSSLHNLAHNLWANIASRSCRLEPLLVLCWVWSQMFCSVVVWFVTFFWDLSFNWSHSPMEQVPHCLAQSQKAHHAPEIWSNVCNFLWLVPTLLHKHRQTASNGHYSPAVVLWPLARPAQINMIPARPVCIQSYSIPLLVINYFKVWSVWSRKDKPSKDFETTTAANRGKVRQKMACKKGLQASDMIRHASIFQNIPENTITCHTL